MAVCQSKIAAKPHQLSNDGKFSWEEVECLGSCANAPMAQIGKDYYEDLTPQRFAEILDELAAGKVPVPGPQNGRYAAEPLSGLTSLKEFDSGRTKYNASVQLAVDIGDTVKRIDGTEVPLTAPWQGVDRTPSGPDAGAVRDHSPEPARATPADDTGVTKQEARAESAAKPEPTPATRGLVVPSKALPGQQELGARRGNWRYGAMASEPAERSVAPESPASEAVRPKALEAPRNGAADDLKMIKGVGPKLEKLLHSMGFFHFDQVAAWTSAEVAWVDRNLEGFKGRVTRDNWVEQATRLATGAETDFSRRAKKDDIYGG